MLMFQFYLNTQEVWFIVKENTSNIEEEKINFPYKMSFIDAYLHLVHLPFKV